MKSIYDLGTDLIMDVIEDVRLSIDDLFKNTDPYAMKKMTPKQSLDYYDSLMPEVKDIMRNEPEWAEWEKKMLNLRGGNYGSRTI